MSEERSYDSPPGMPALFARAGVGLIPGASRLPFVGGGRGKAEGSQGKGTSDNQAF